MKKIFLIIFLFVSTIGFSQSPNDSIIHKENIDIRYLENMCLEVFNSYRYSKGDYKLKIDSTLCKSSKQHSQWMGKNKKFEHSHSGVGENILNLSLGWGPTYKLMSEVIIKSWIDSPPHNENMLSNNYTSVGLGIEMTTSKDGIRWFYVTLQLN